MTAPAKRLSAERVKLTKAQAATLRFIVREGPGTLRETKQGRMTAAVAQLLAAGFLETLNRLRPGPAMYEITAAGRAALALTGGQS